METEGYVGFAILGIFYLLIVYGLLSRALKIKLRLNKIIKLKPSSIKQLLKSKPGKIVKILGKVTSEHIKKAPYTNRDCVFHHSTRKDLVEGKDKIELDGERRQNFYYMTMEEFKSSEPFYIEDSTGKVLIYPEDIFIDGRRVVGGESPELMANYSKKGTQFDNDFNAHSNAEERKKLEQILTPKQPVIAVGELVFNNGQVSLISPKSKNQMGFVTAQTLSQIKSKANKYFLIYFGSLIIVSILGGLAVYYVYPLI
ncbi:MAG: GIDE domain-containing protein [Candidatus Rifleibacteriota bacterium]